MERAARPLSVCGAGEGDRQPCVLALAPSPAAKSSLQCSASLTALAGTPAAVSARPHPLGRPRPAPPPLPRLKSAPPPASCAAQCTMHRCWGAAGRARTPGAGDAPLARSPSRLPPPELHIRPSVSIATASPAAASPILLTNQCACVSPSPVAQPCPRPPSGPSEPGWARALFLSSEAECRSNGDPPFLPELPRAPGPRAGCRSPSCFPTLPRRPQPPAPVSSPRCLSPPGPDPSDASPGRPLARCLGVFGEAMDHNQGRTWSLAGVGAHGWEYVPLTLSPGDLRVLSHALPVHGSSRRARQTLGEKTQSGKWRGCRGVHHRLRKRGSRAKMAGFRKGGQGRGEDASRAHGVLVQLVVTGGWDSRGDSGPSPGPALPDPFLLPPRMQITVPTPWNP